MTVVGSLGVLFVLLVATSTVLGGLMTGLFFAYSVSVVLALDTLPGSAYVRVIQSINEKILNVVFGMVFGGAIFVPIVGAAIVIVRGYWTTFAGQSYLAGVIIYLVGTAWVTIRIHIPMNEYIATWSIESPPDDWSVIRSRWGRWNHVRTIAAFVSFVLYITAVLSFSASMSATP